MRFTKCMASEYTLTLIVWMEPFGRRQVNFTTIHGWKRIFIDLSNRTLGIGGDGIVLIPPLRDNDQISDIADFQLPTVLKPICVATPPEYMYRSKYFYDNQLTEKNRDINASETGSGS